EVMNLRRLLLFASYFAAWIRSCEIRPERYLFSRMPQSNAGGSRCKGEAVSGAPGQESRIPACLSAVFFKEDGKGSRMLHMRTEEHQDASCGQELEEFHCFSLRAITLALRGFRPRAIGLAL